MSQERDTHFQNFAKLLWREIASEIDALSTEENGVNDGCFVCCVPEAKVTEALAPLIARRAYDLVYHALEQASHGEHAFDAEIVFKDQVSDLTKWPE